MNDDNTLSLKTGTRLRTGGASYEVTKDASVPAGLVPVKPGGTRLLKVYCPSCGYTVRVTKRWLDKAVPVCPVCHITMTEGTPKTPKVDKAEIPAPRPRDMAKAKPVVLPEPIAVVTPEPVITETPSPLAELLAEL